MASRQFGKLRQWAGEVISSREKTAYSEDFQEAEKVIDQRKNGAERIAVAAEAYCRNLSKKRDVEDSEKMLPVDALGVSMIVHGEEIGDDSDFGRSLILFGRAHCKVATFQETLALNIKETFVDTLESFDRSVKEYEAQRRKLDSRRLAYDAASSKMEKLKGSRKEKERMEAEEELERAKFRFEETTEDVRALMAQVQDHETQLMKALTNLLNLELNFVQKYLESLEEAKSDWPERSLEGPTSGKVHGSLSSTPSLRRKKSTSSSKFGSARRNDHHSPTPPETDSEEEKDRRAARSRRNSEASHKRMKSDASTKSRSRPGSSLGNNKEGITSRFSVSGVAGWASNAVGGVIGGNRKDRETFANLDEDGKKSIHGSDEEAESTAARPSRHSIRSGLSMRLSSRTKSREKTPSPKVQPKIIKTPLKPRIVKALYDFNGSADELGFKAGDEIRVINEVLDDWWMGEIIDGNGKQGLFPTSFVQTNPATPSASETEDDIYGHQPMSAVSGMYLGTSDAMSISSADENKGLMKERSENVESGESQARKILGALDPTNLRRPFLQRTPSDASLSSNTNSSLSGGGATLKKPPPPPPPRRQSTNSGTPPSLPARKPGLPGAISRSQSSTPSFPARITTSSLQVGDRVGYDTSPFESAADLMVGKDEGACRDFKQNPFKPKGLCSNCWEYHDQRE